jgi:hypothetical protein
MIVYTLLGLLPSASSIGAPWMRRSISMPSRARRARHFIRKVYETDPPLTCPKSQGGMWFDKLTTLRKLEGRIISFIDQPDVIKKILEHLGLWEESQVPPG